MNVDFTINIWFLISVIFYKDGRTRKEVRNINLENKYY